MQLHAGYISDGIKNYLYKRNGPLDWKDLLYFLSVFELETNEDLTVRNYESLFAVADNIISRGLPTKPSIFVEQTLSDTFKWTERKINSIGEINYKLAQENEDKLLLLRRAFINIEPRIRNVIFGSISSSESALEREFFENRLGHTFGEHCLQIIESQRSLPDIINFCGNMISKPLVDLANRFIEHNAVDFSIQFPKNNQNKKNGIVIEIDDDTHNPQINPAQAGFDNQRDNAVTDSKVNWERTIRLRRYKDYNEINSIPEGKINSINNFLQHPYCVQLKNNFDDPLYNSAEGLNALQLALTPIAVARIQKLIISLLSANVLRLDQEKWNLTILERDVPCGKLAVEDLKQLILNLFNLRYENSKLPEIEIRIFNTQEFSNAKLNHNVETEIYDESGNKIKEFKADILIDVSVLQRPNLSKPSDEFLKRVGNPKVFLIRSCHAPKSERKISIEEVIRYKELITKENGHNIYYLKRINSLRYLLNTIFRKYSFREGQIEIINRAIQGQNIVGLLPTGSGKSLCYQLCALLQPGLSIIVDPLISLMKDQVQNLVNLDITFIDKINSEINDPTERSFRISRMKKKYNQFIFISPERFQTLEFRDALHSVQIDKIFLQVVIDEAHCVSEWGHDFRPAYLHLGKNARNLISQDVILFGLTGTASFDVLSDVAREVNINQQGLVEANSFDREELKFSIQPKRFKKEQAFSGRKFDVLKEILRLIPRYFGKYNLADFYNEMDESGFKNCGIIFCPHGSIEPNTNSPFCVGTIHKAIVELFNKEFNITISTDKYSGDLQNEDRELVQNRFKANETQILVSTNAFGMGIDKPNIRYIIHYSCPQSIEAYYQEAGRAGRDRDKALCISLFSDDKIFFKDLAGTPSPAFILDINDLYTSNYLNEEENGSEAIEIQNGNIVNCNYDFRNNPMSESICINYTNFYLSNNNTNEEVNSISRPDFKDNDATRRTYFLGKNFPSKEIEKKIFGGVLSQINLNVPNSIIPFKIQYHGLDLDDTEKGNGYVERGIYRLAIIGVIKDYIKDYNSHQYTIESDNLNDDQIIKNIEMYVSRYKSRAAVNNVENEIRNINLQGIDQSILRKAIYYLIDFIYENIERKRRNALREFIRVLRIGSSNIVKFREEMDNYFNSKYLPKLRDYITNYGINVLWELINEIGNNYGDLRHLHGAVVRLLIAYDDNLLFQLIRSYTSFFHPEFDKREAMDYFNAFEKSYLREELNRPNRRMIGEWIDRFYYELTSRQPTETVNVSNAVLNYELNILKNFNNKFINQR